MAALFREHAAGLHRYLVRLTGDEATAKDAVQHAFLRMLQRPPDGRNPRAWLYTVATHAARDWASRESRRGRLLERRKDAVPKPAAAPSPERTLEKSIQGERLRAALARLPERDRTILLMRSEGFRHREIAEAVGTTTGSVGTLVARALDRLGGILEEDMDGEDT